MHLDCTHLLEQRLQLCQVGKVTKQTEVCAVVHHAMCRLNAQRCGFSGVPQPDGWEGQGIMGAGMA
jgi:hypothetical protein